MKRDGQKENPHAPKKPQLARHLDIDSSCRVLGWGNLFDL
jgi:hypothetical protein